MIRPYPDFEQFKTVEVYVYHDRPLLFSCQDILGQKYFAVLVDEDDEENQTWLYVPVSPQRFESIRLGMIDLHTAFGEPEAKYIYYVVVSPGISSPQVTVVDQAEINPDWLPKLGVKLEAAEIVERHLGELSVRDKLVAEQQISQISLEGTEKLAHTYTWRENLGWTFVYTITLLFALSVTALLIGQYEIVRLILIAITSVAAGAGLKSVLRDTKDKGK